MHCSSTAVSLKLTGLQAHAVCQLPNRESTSNGLETFPARNYARRLIVRFAFYGNRIKVIPKYLSNAGMAIARYGHVQPVLRLLKSKTAWDVISNHAPPMAAPPLPQGYAPIRPLGRGAYGEVWLCTHQSTAKPVAVKVLTEQTAIERAATEVEALAALSGNPNILQLVETLSDNERMYIVTDFVDGGDILKYMQDRGCRPLAEEEARRLFRQLVFALDAVHRSGWVHRDIKCENVLLSAARDRVIIADFGFAGKWAPDRQLNEPLGSLHYSSPEIVTARPYTGPEVDVWSLGVVLYALCFGRLPFGGASEDEIADRILTGQYPTPVGASPALCTLLAMMLHPNPTDRAKLDAVKRSDWLMSGVENGAAQPPLVLRSKTTGSAIGGRPPHVASRPRRSSTSSLAEGLFRRITQAKLAESDGAEGAHQPKTTNEVAVAGPATTGADADSGMMTRLSRFTTHGVKRFSLTRLFKGRTTN